MALNIFLSIIGWVTIMVLYHLDTPDGMSRYEILKDGNNLFKTCFFYIIGDAICRNTSISTYALGISAIMIILAVPPTFSSLNLLFNNFATIEQKLSALLNSIIPLVIGINCLILYGI